MSEPVLQVKGLKTYYYTEEGVVPAVDGLDFEVEPGETFAIVGESGCGKSVTSLSILRLIPSPPGKIIDGEIIYHGQDLVKKSEREMRNIRGNDISMIFQEPMTSLNPVFTVGQQIGESFRFHQQMGKAEMLKKSIEMLRLVGIPEPEHVRLLLRNWLAENFTLLCRELDDEVRSSLISSGIVPPPTRIAIKDMKSRWGSCTWAKGHISINFRLAAYPRETVLSVFWHEYAHYWHHDHSARFYAFLGKHYPEYRKWNSLLK